MIYDKGKDEDMIQEKCPYAEKCGACHIGQTSYEEELTAKKKTVEQYVGKYCKVNDVAGMYYPFHYRNKVHAVFGRLKDEVIAGTYSEGTHTIVPVQDCLIEDTQASAIIKTVTELVKSFKIWVYNEDTGRGIIRHVLVRKGMSTKQIMVVLVTACPEFPHKNNFVAELRKRHPEITTIVQNINEQNTTMVLGERNKPLYGEGYIEDVLCGLRFRISPNSFYQVNSAQTQVLYKKAIQAAGLTGKETVIDAYCGIGTIGMAMAPKAGKVLGIELNRDAVKDAKANAKRNNINNIHFVAADATEYMTQMSENGAKADVVVMDPPRSGSTEEFIQAVSVLSPAKVVYVSCNPETLGRDLEIFQTKGYQAVEAWPVDMFGWTNHVETVVLLSQRKADDVIEVEIELDELDLTSAESKATYKEIQEYVLKEHGLKVSNLYISQVKRKCGIEVGENYNLPRSEDSRQPQCPEDKEKAIRDALEHFRMV
ncbi:MAG: 23S rRNA (uracil(1939)-C(5))-methyltransferase RlmD [Lachnospiraceae bacterium]|nr:23S rRNA (uracil(1939)-C(5))-methyltransferase RlmD [Lachnospiraceae bacterium]